MNSSLDRPRSNAVVGQADKDDKVRTRDGMLIDHYDSFGIQRPDLDPGQKFEAGWTKDGAVCVRHVRVKENVTLEALEALPSLRGRTGDVCTEEFARAHGQLFSFDQSREASNVAGAKARNALRRFLRPADDKIE